ncbi:aminopeptidase P family protein [Gordonia rubripertincta]|uniref:Aminopeptidase P family protein n=1 Tax=Gordonia rubripertincta TaxID=36822 RepID=A0AAW4GAA4_GORRU|nr:M24 family metallopeptidase [Gordonia rubripertincta]MBM7280060.1 aminopeptidase P family protein [Gordonia rubripertincta]
MSQSLSERDRRWALLNKAMADHGLDALIFAANDYRGHKGSIRYVADYNLCHKSGNAVMFRDSEPFLVLSGSLVGARKPDSDWVSDYRFPGTTAEGLVDALRRRPKFHRVGIVGLNQVMKVGEYLALTEAYPHVVFIDFSHEFERIRAVKSAYEIAGAEESAYILDQCFSRLLEIVRPGITEREVAAEMYKVGCQVGGEDPLFLSMHTDFENIHSHSTFDTPRDRVLKAHDVHTFSFEIIGPRGYWTELSRMVTFARPDELIARMGRAVAKGISAGAEVLRGGAKPGDIQRRVLAGVESEGAKSSYWSGHSLGLDVIEDPMIGLDVVEDGEQSLQEPLADSMVITLHPMVSDATEIASGYMSDTFVVDEHGSRKLSEHPTGLYRISNGAIEVDEY